MRKHLNKPWFVGLLVVLAAGLVAYEGFGLPAGGFNSRGGVAAGGAEAPEAPIEERVESAAVALTAAEMFVATGGRDPFAARAVSTTAAGKANETIAPHTETLKLAAVWLQGAESFVAINSRICRVGDTVAGAAIESVTREGAWLRLPSGRQFLPVGREVTFVAPSNRGPSPLLVVTRER